MEWVECACDIQRYTLDEGYNPAGRHWLELPPAMDTVITDPNVIDQAERQIETRPWHDAGDAVKVHRPFTTAELDRLRDWQFHYSKATLNFQPDPVNVYIVGEAWGGSSTADLPTIAYVINETPPSASNFVFPLSVTHAPSLQDNENYKRKGGHELLAIVRDNQLEVWDPCGAWNTLRIAHTVVSALNKLPAAMGRFKEAPAEVYGNWHPDSEHVHRYGVQTRFSPNGYCQSWVWLKAKDLAENGYPGKLEAVVKETVAPIGGGKIGPWAKEHFAPIINSYESGLITDDHLNPRASVRTFEWFPQAFRDIAQSPGSKFQTWCASPDAKCPSTDDPFVSVSFSGGARLDAKKRAPRKWKIGDPFTAADLADVEKTRHMVQANPDWKSTFLSKSALIEYLVQERAPPESLKLIFSYASTFGLRNQILSDILQDSPNSVHLRAMKTWIEIDERPERLVRSALFGLKATCTHETNLETLKACVLLFAPKCDNDDLAHVINQIEMDIEDAAESGEEAPASSRLLPLLRQFSPEPHDNATTTMAFADQ